MEIKGAKKLRIDKKTGELIAETELGKVKFTRPFAFQKINGKRVNIKVSYKLLAKNLYSFEVGKYDCTRLLVIDPLLTSTYLGGSGHEFASSIAIGPDSNVYVIGATSSGNFPITDEAYRRSYKGGDSDIFISKLSADLSHLLVSTYLGGEDEDIGHSIAIDLSGNIYIAGSTDSSNFPTTGGAYQKFYKGGISDVFISKLSANLSCLLASTYLGGKGLDRAESIAVGPDSTVYIAGATDSSNFPITDRAYQRQYGGGEEEYDAFISKLSGDLSHLLASTYLGGNDADVAYSIAIDVDGNVYVAGYAESSNFPITAGAYQRFYGGNRDAFIAKLSTDLSHLFASTYLGGKDGDIGLSIATDPSGNIYIAGWTFSSNFPITDRAYQRSLGFSRNSDAFISKLSSDLGANSSSSSVFTTHIENWNADVNSGGVTVGNDAADGILTGNEKLVFEINFPSYTKPVDVYIAVGIPNLGTYLLTSNAQFEPLQSSNIVPYAKSVLEIPNLSFDPIPIHHPTLGCILPNGEYFICSLVVPADTNLLLWFKLKLPGELTCYNFRVECED